MTIPVERDMPAGPYLARREHLVMTINSSTIAKEHAVAAKPRRRALRLPVIVGVFALAAGGGIAVAATAGSNPHSTLDLTSPSVNSTTACVAADWHCIPALAATLHKPVLGPTQDGDARITNIVYGKKDAQGAPLVLSYLWTDPATKLVVFVTSMPASGPLRAPFADENVATIHGLPAVEGTAPGSGVQWVEAGRRWSVTVSPDTTMDKTVEFAQSLVPYQP